MTSRSKDRNDGADKEGNVNSCRITLRKGGDTEKLNEKALDRRVWRTRLRRGYGLDVRQRVELTINNK
jgi:hypothetical protein